MSLSNYSKQSILSEHSCPSPPQPQQHFSHRMIAWLQLITSQYKCMSHLNLFRNQTISTNSTLAISSQKICEIYHSQDEFFMNNGLLFIGIMNHYFPKHVKNPDLASVNFQKEMEVVWTLAHTHLEIPCHYSLEEYKLHSSHGNCLNFSKLGKHLEEYYFFLNNDHNDGIERNTEEIHMNSKQNEKNKQFSNSKKHQLEVLKNRNGVISSASSLVTALGHHQSTACTTNSVLTKQHSPTNSFEMKHVSGHEPIHETLTSKIEDTIVLEFNTHRVACSSQTKKMQTTETMGNIENVNDSNRMMLTNAKTKKPLPTLPVTSSLHHGNHVEKSSIGTMNTNINPQLEKEITQLVIEDHEEKTQPIFFSKTAYVDKEDSEEYYQKFRY
ncbi:hypothetical protein FDP41_008310 [Naegleria fowleri]|uniref:Uncharacterized protein n=1 Tax=Naegleria fowleri TaxID=5763 RepID=A0A6A5BG37_NAEFO|nr:uncharacterized protein FDP41_008310 [Naegleria fowleri]KAF0973606.1 hypothetical protein FDP41_008310 [Naegleria fowleri]CAG4719484.1 unnamed protein product [Naegleria fowleri]